MPRRLALQAAEKKVARMWKKAKEAEEKKVSVDYHALHCTHEQADPEAIFLTNCGLSTTKQTHGTCCFCRNRPNRRGTRPMESWWLRAKHRFVYYYHVLLRHESLRDVFTFLVTRFEHRPPRFVIYDNACELLRYCERVRLTWLTFRKSDCDAELGCMLMRDRSTKARP